jgi:hypothetical protein
MHYLAPALLAEGPTDQRLLGPVLRRLCEDLCLRHSQRPVEVDEVRELCTPQRFRGSSLDVRILEAVRQSGTAFDVVFLHTDGRNDPERARAERITPACDRIASDLGKDHCEPVAVVPVRETEAWALADGDALRRAFGCTISDEDMGLPRNAGDVETVADPKRLLENAWAAAVGRHWRKRASVKDYLTRIGEEIRLDILRAVPAFQSLDSELHSVLDQLGFFR